MSRRALAADVLARGRAAWPDVSLELATIEAHLAGLPEPPTLAHAADLYLACACSRGLPAAIARFESTCVAGVGRRQS